MEEIQSLINNANTSKIQLVIGLDALKELCSYFVQQEFDRQKKLKEQENDGLLDCKHVMELLNVKYESLWRWNKSGYLPCLKIGRRSYWRREDVEEILGKREKNDDN